MSCSSASHSVPRWRRSAASPLSSSRPQVLSGSKFFSLNFLPLVMRNGSTYFWIRFRISFLDIAQPPFVAAQFSVSYSIVHQEVSCAPPHPSEGEEAAKNAQLALDIATSGGGTVRFPSTAPFRP